MDEQPGIDDILLKVLAHCHEQGVAISWSVLASLLLEYLSRYPQAAGVRQLQRLAVDRTERYQQLLVEFTSLRVRGFACWGKRHLVITCEGRIRASGIQIPSEIGLLIDLIGYRARNGQEG